MPRLHLKVDDIDVEVRHQLATDGDRQLWMIARPVLVDPIVFKVIRKSDDSKSCHDTVYQAVEKFNSL